MLFLDESGFTDLRHIIHASRADPCEDVPYDDRTWSIIIILRTGQTMWHEYPTEAQREAALTRMLGMLREMMATLTEEEEE